RRPCRCDAGPLAIGLQVAGFPCVEDWRSEQTRRLVNSRELTGWWSSCAPRSLRDSMMEDIFNPASLDDLFGIVRVAYSLIRYFVHHLRYAYVTLLHIFRHFVKVNVPVFVFVGSFPENVLPTTYPPLVYH